MANVTIRNLSPESKERLRQRAEQRGCTLEALARMILEQAAGDSAASTEFPHDLIAVVEPDEEIEPSRRDYDQPPTRFQLRDASVKGSGRQPVFRDAGWAEVRRAVYEGRGG